MLSGKVISRATRSLLLVNGALHAFVKAKIYDCDIIISNIEFRQYSLPNLTEADPDLKETSSLLEKVEHGKMKRSEKLTANQKQKN